MENPTYIGDGVYIKQGSWQGEVIIYTSNGITEENHIYLGPQEIEALKRFCAQVFGKTEAPNG